MNFREALSVLSKSSPYAVSTEKEPDDSNVLNQIKEQLYIQTEIEVDFKRILDSIEPNDKKLVFLCGSSGDGKSEILTRYKKRFSDSIKFHLDATHSFEPEATAIETLDNLFNDYLDGNAPLVVGINTGMLGNYAEEGKNLYVTEAIKEFLNGVDNTKEVHFLDFEDYPKFTLELESYDSAFIKSFLMRFTSGSNNIIREVYEQELQSQSAEQLLCSNYQLLSIPEVQEAIVDLLLKARLVKDQFLTARALLDFIFSLLAGPGYIFDNLFLDKENELSSKITSLDPVNHRTQRSDEFILSQHLNLKNDDFVRFKTALADLGIKRSLSPESFLRAFYLLRKASIGNDFHINFKNDFDEYLLADYSRVWTMHDKFYKNSEFKLEIRKFYKDVVIAALHRYMNKNAPKLEKGHYLLSDCNGVHVCCEINIQPDFAAITKNRPKNNASFNVCLKAEDQTIMLPMNINLFELLGKIIEGYRPNKHDKSTVVMLDDLVDKLVEAANSSNTLFLVTKNKRIKVTKIDEDEIEVSGV